MKLEVPNKLGGIPLKAYQSYLEIEEPKEQDVLRVLLGIDRDVMRRMKSKSVTELGVHLKNLMDRDHKLIRRFKMNGIEFGFIPNLDKATSGEIWDVEELIGNPKTMHQAMAVLYRKVTYENKKTKQYTIEKYEPGKYDDMMRECPLDVVLGANVFFYTLTSDLLNAIPKYMKEEVAQHKNSGHSIENGEDITDSIRLLEGTVLNLKMHPNYLSTQL